LASFASDHWTLSNRVTPTAAFAPSPNLPASSVSFLPNRAVRPAPRPRPALGNGLVPSQRRRREAE
jgi:hypothetical protein